MKIDPVYLSNDDEIRTARAEPWRIEYALAITAAEVDLDGVSEAYYELCTEIGLLIESCTTLSDLAADGVINADRAGEIAEAIYLGADAKDTYGSDLAEKAKTEDHAAVLQQIIIDAS